MTQIQIARADEANELDQDIGPALSRRCRIGVERIRFIWEMGDRDENI
jgi:hypothetical protein